MFNKKYKEEIVFLKNSIQAQAIELSEVKDQCKIYLQKLAFSEGQIQAIQELNETLKNQLQLEISRASRFEALMMQGYQVSTEKFEEVANGMFDEDTDKLKELYKDFEEDKGDL